MSPLPIAIIGGGPAGSACARKLALAGHPVILLERRPAHIGPRPGETCGPGLQRAIEAELSLTIPRSLYRPLHSICSAWGSDQLDGRSLPLWSAGEGLVLDRAAFDEWLLDAAGSAGVTVHRGVQLIDGRWEGGDWLLDGTQGGEHRSFRACLTVEATGSAVRSPLQADATRVFRDQQICLSAELPGDPVRTNTDPATAIIESCAEGWWYTVELPSGNRTAGLFTDADLLGSTAQRRALFTAALESTTHVRRAVGRLDGHVPDILVTSARTSARRLLWRGPWLAVGDAAWSLDPLSGTGIERAVRDALDAAGAITRALQRNDLEELRAHAVTKAEAFGQQLAIQRRYYEAERRWAAAPFWHRRRAA